MPDRHTPSPEHAQKLQRLLTQAVLQHRQGQLKQAKAGYLAVLALDPQHADALQMMGVIAGQAQQFDEAAHWLEQALSVRPHDPAILCNLANALRELGQHDAALEQLDAALRHQPGLAQAWVQRARLLQQQGRLEDAVASYTRCIDLGVKAAELHFERAAVLADLGQTTQALQDFERAVQIDPRNADAHNRRGLLQQRLGQLEAAQQSYLQAIQHNPAHAGAHHNLGTLFIDRGHLATAAEHFRAALRIKPDHVNALYSLGFALWELKQLPEAVSVMERARELAPDRPYLLGDLTFCRLRMCDWRELPQALAQLRSSTPQHQPLAYPFQLLSCLDEPALHRSAAERWVRDVCPEDPQLGPIQHRQRPERLRIGYFSPDFGEHPLAYLTAELFERHDRDRFEVFGFSLGLALPGDAMRTRLATAFDHFIDVRGLTDLQVAERARQLKIDIAVDLAGHTAGCRPGIFALRAAPVQVSYLGYLGTLGASWMDYLIADAHIVSNADREFYTERIINLPSYQVNDSTRAASSRVFSRCELGLPAEGFVFCCFNAAYKITPPVFERWMRILLAVEGSTLVLVADNEWVQSNLTREAQQMGVAPDRIVFAPRLARPDYLARYRCADLFLDTAPYNAGTTASDALWMGLPVLTCQGRSFASRIASSLLFALDLPELVTHDLDAYESMAVSLARNPDQLALLRARLVKNRSTAMPFDTPRFTRTLEATFDAVFDRWQAGLGPQHLGWSVPTEPQRWNWG